MQRSVPRSTVSAERETFSSLPAAGLLPTSTRNDLGPNPASRFDRTRSCQTRLSGAGHVPPAASERLALRPDLAGPPHEPPRPGPIPVGRPPDDASAPRPSSPRRSPFRRTDSGRLDRLAIDQPSRRRGGSLFSTTLDNAPPCANSRESAATRLSFANARKPHKHFSNSGSREAGPATDSLSF